MNQIAKCHRGRVTCIAVGMDFLFTGGEVPPVRTLLRGEVQAAAEGRGAGGSRGARCPPCGCCLMLLDGPRRMLFDAARCC